MFFLVAVEDLEDRISALDLHWTADLADGQRMRQVVDTLIVRLGIGTEGQVPVVVVGTGAEGVGAG